MIEGIEILAQPFEALNYTMRRALWRPRRRVETADNFQTPPLHTPPEPWVVRITHLLAETLLGERNAQQLQSCVTPQLLPKIVLRQNVFRHQSGKKRMTHRVLTVHISPVNDFATEVNTTVLLNNFAIPLAFRLECLEKTWRITHIDCGPWWQ